MKMGVHVLELPFVSQPVSQSLRHRRGLHKWDQQKTLKRATPPVLVNVISNGDPVFVACKNMIVLINAILCDGSKTALHRKVNI